MKRLGRPAASACAAIALLACMGGCSMVDNLVENSAAGKVQSFSSEYYQEVNNAVETAKSLELAVLDSGVNYDVMSSRVADVEGDKVAVLHAKATNEAEDARSLVFEVASIEAAQDGTTLSHIQASSVPGTQNQDSKVVSLSPGESIESDVCFALNNASSPIELQMGVGDKKKDVTVELA